VSGEPLLRVRGLVKHFAAGRGLFGGAGAIVKAVDGVDFEITGGETLGLVGETGSGKSTAAFCAAGLLRPNAGRITFMERELTSLRRAELRRIRRDLQIVFQDPYSSLDPRLTIGRSIEEPLVAHGIDTRRGRRSRVQALLEEVGFDPDLAGRYPHEFSGGQRQRVAIARAIALRPKLVVCDEPVSALDVSVQAQILNLLKDLQRAHGLTYLFISHDLAVVRTMCDWVAVMRDGKVVEQGAAESLYTHPAHPYTTQLLESVPLPDPVRIRERRSQRGRSTEGVRTGNQASEPTPP
jgi:oligopeptide transport system ATP-binding protein